MTKAHLNHDEARKRAQCEMVNNPSNPTTIHLFTVGLRGSRMMPLGRQGMLYLHFSLITFLYGLVMCAIHAPHLYFYYTSTVSENNIFVRLSIKNWNFKNGGYVNLILAFLEIVSCIVTIGYVRFMIWFSDWTNDRANNLSTADFAVHVRGVPRDEVNHGLNRIIHYFSSFGRIVQCAMALDTGNVAKLNRKRLAYRRKIERCYASNGRLFGTSSLATVFCCCCNLVGGLVRALRLMYYRFRLSMVNREIRRHLAKDKFTCTGDVFIVYETELERYRCLHAFNRSACFRVFTNGAKFANNRSLAVEPAMEPEDVVWENLEYGRLSKFVRQIVAIVVSMFFMGVVAGASGVLEFIRTTYFNCDTCGVADVLKTKDLKNNVSWASYGISLIVWVVNSILAYIMFFTSRFEKHRFKSRARVSLTYKLTFATLLVTLAMAVVYSRFDRSISGLFPWFKVKGGIPPLVEGQLFYYNIFNVILIAVVLNIGKEILLGPYHALVRYYFVKASVTQEDLNEAYRRPLYSYPYRYANQLRIFIIAIAFSGMFPLAIFIVTGGMFFSYFVDKFNIIYVYRSKSNDEDKLCKSAVNIVTCGYLARFILLGITHIYRVLSEDPRNVVSFFVISWIVSTSAFLLYFVLHFAFLSDQSLIKKLLCCMSSFRYPDFVTEGGMVSILKFRLPAYRPPLTLDELKVGKENLKKMYKSDNSSPKV